MASSLAPVRAQVRTFLAGGPIAPFWTAVMEAAASVDADASLSQDERDWFDELYDFVYMAANDPLADDAGAPGAARSEALRAQLRELGLDVA